MSQGNSVCKGPESWKCLEYLDMNLSKLQEMVKDRGAWHADVHGAPRVGNNSVTEQQQQYLANGWVEVLGVRV